MPQHLITGKKGEDQAADYLKDNGYTVILRNYRHKHGEIDIITEKDGLLVFVEVKTRSGTAFGYPEEAVDEKKAEVLLRTAEEYIFETDWQGDFRFDIIAITKGKLEHFKDAVC